MGDSNLVGFYMLHENSTDTIDQLRAIRAKPSKFICLNDNMDDPDEKVRRPSFLSPPSVHLPVLRPELGTASMTRRSSKRWAISIEAFTRCRPPSSFRLEVSGPSPCPGALASLPSQETLSAFVSQLCRPAEVGFVPLTARAIYGGGVAQRTATPV